MHSVRGQLSHRLQCEWFFPGVEQNTGPTLTSGVLGGREYGIGQTVTIVTALNGGGGPGFPRWNSPFLLNRFYRIHWIVESKDILG